MRQHQSQSGFTLMEIIVATAIFAVTVSGILILFNYTLRINADVQLNRQATQGLRNFTEILAREVRNGDIYYPVTWESGHCPPDYTGKDNHSLAIITNDGDKLCFYVDYDGIMYVEKQTSNGVVSEVVNPPNLTIDYSTFRFLVFPQTDPEVQVSGTYPGVQPVVQMIGDFTVSNNKDTKTISYQTSISSDNYEIPHK